MEVNAMAPPSSRAREHHAWQGLLCNQSTYILPLLLFGLS